MKIHMLSPGSKISMCGFFCKIARPKSSLIRTVRDTEILCRPCMEAYEESRARRDQVTWKRPD